MSDPVHRLPRPADSAGKVVLLPATKFFVRRIPLVPGQDAGAQAELALETAGPFAPAQLYLGFHASADGREALVFAAYRRNVPPEQSAAWGEAEAVLPSFAFWLTQPPPAVPEVWLHRSDGEMGAVFWDGRSPVPAGVLARESTGQEEAALRASLVEEAARRLGGPVGEVREFEGTPAVGALTKQGLRLTLGDRTGDFTPAQLRVLDVRDKAELARRVVRGRRDHRLWLAFAASVALLAAAVAGEAGLGISRALLARQRARLEEASAEVRRIEQAGQLVARMEQLAGQSLRPFEMLAQVNALRPPALEFVRATTAGPLRLEIEAQSGNAADPQAYEQALRGARNIGRVELRDLRTSGGRTTFLVAVDFKPGFAGNGGAP